jgi:hypothetical protein
MVLSVGSSTCWRIAALFAIGGFSYMNASASLPAYNRSDPAPVDDANIANRRRGNEHWASIDRGDPIESSEWPAPSHLSGRIFFSR